MTDFQKRVKAVLSDHGDNGPRCKKDGSVEVRRSYFYRMGMDEEKYAGLILEKLARKAVPAYVRGEDHYHNWPKTSYFVAVIRETAIS